MDRSRDTFCLEVNAFMFYAVQRNILTACYLPRYPVLPRKPNIAQVTADYRLVPWCKKSLWLRLWAECKYEGLSSCSQAHGTKSDPLSLLDACAMGVPKHASYHFYYMRGLHGNRANLKGE